MPQLLALLLVVGLAGTAKPGPPPGTYLTKVTPAASPISRRRPVGTSSPATGCGCSDGALTFTVVHVPDRLARLCYTAHPWRKIR